MHSPSAVDIYRAQRKHINYSIWPMRISRHDLWRRYSNSLVIDAGSQFSLRTCSQAKEGQMYFYSFFLILRTNKHSNPSIFNLKLSTIFLPIVHSSFSSFSTQREKLGSLCVFDWLPRPKKPSRFQWTRQILWQDTTRESWKACNRTWLVGKVKSS
jgi:hypothetical protein